MSNSDIITEKVYCHDNPSNDNGMLAALMNNGMGGQWNNPFIYLVWMMFANRFFGNGQESVANSTQQAEIMAKLNAMDSQMSSNQNTNMLMDAINGNHEALHSLSSALGVDFATTQGAINGVQNAITAVGGQVGMSAQQVINSVLLGNKDLTAALQSCCCENKQLVQKMGYENQLAIKDQTYAINDRLTGIANGLQKGFSDLGYILAQNKGDIINGQNAVGQRIIDTLNNHWQQDLAQRLQDAKFETSQLKQNQYLVSALGGNCNCGCN